MPFGRWHARTRLCALLLWAVGAVGLAAEVDYPPPKAGREGRGRLEFSHGVPILHLCGTPRQMGHQHGTLLRGQIAALRRGYLDKLLGSGLKRDAFLFSALGLTEHMPKGVVAEMRALAKGAGEPYPNILLANTFLDTTRAVQCSVVIAQEKATRQERLLFARNTDWPTLDVAHKASLLIVYHHEGGEAHPFVSVGWPGMVGVISGMNDAGLCVATLVSLSSTDAQAGMPYPMMLRQILERCTTPQEALALVKATKRTCANNLAVAGPKGGPLIIEFSPSTVAARSPVGDVLLATNHFRSPAQVAAPKPMDHRYTTLERLVAKAHGRRDVPVLKEMLGAVGMSGMNLQAMVFEPAARRLHLSIGRVPASRGPFVLLDLASLLRPR